MINLQLCLPMREGDTWKVNPGENFNIGSHSKASHNVFTQYPKGPNCNKSKVTKSTRARCNTKSRKRKSDARSENFVDLITADHKVLNDESESRCRYRDAFIVEDEHTNWIQGLPRERKRSRIQWVVCRDFVSPSQKPGIIFTDNSKELLKSCQELQWNRAETNGVAERAVRRLKEGTAVVLAQCGLSSLRWDCALECDCRLRNLQDRMADNRTAFVKRFGKAFDGLTIPLGSSVEYLPIYLHRQVQDQSVWKDKAEGDIFWDMYNERRGILSSD